MREYTLIQSDLESRFDSINPSLVTGLCKSPHRPPVIAFQLIITNTWNIAVMIKITWFFIVEEIGKNILKSLVARVKALSKDWRWKKGYLPSTNSFYDLAFPQLSLHTRGQKTCTVSPL